MSRATSAKSGENLTLHVLGGIATTVSRLLFILFVLVVAVKILSYFEDAREYKYVRYVIEAEQAIEEPGVEFVKANLPHTIIGRDLSWWIFALVVFLLIFITMGIADIFHHRAEYLSHKMELDEMKRRAHISNDAPVLQPLEKSLEDFHRGARKDRQKLLAIFAETKKKLDETGRDLAFLSIDVADSTEMKVGEDPAIVERDFGEYKQLVQKIIDTNGALKSSWTPDGAMTCFPTVDDAVQAAKDVIAGLKDFNANVKAIKRDFHVRCGINSGFVYFDESVPMEEMSDRGIDIAGHMQKMCKPNTIAIARPAIEPLSQRHGFQPTSQVVDGYQVYEWKEVEE